MTNSRGVAARMYRIFVLLLALAGLATAADTLDIYFVDVEGGAATLMVTPAGETVLMDAGWLTTENRDAERIRKVLTEQAGADKIDYLIMSHYHEDHVGGLPALAGLVPIDAFLDHGDSVELGRELGRSLFQNYLAAADGKRRQVKPGDKLPLRGVDFLFVTSHSQFIEKPLGPATPNPYCEGAELHRADRSENGKSVGFVLRFGGFKFIDIGDVTWNYEHELACPVNRLGEADLYQTTHHGMNMSGAPQLAQAINPTVAVMNNGPTKGGSPEVYQILKRAPDFQDLWQGHYAVNSSAEQNTGPRLIANLTETEDCEGHWIKISVRTDGTYTVTNSRNGFSKTYSPRGLP